MGAIMLIDATNFNGLSSAVIGGPDWEPFPSTKARTNPLGTRYSPYTNSLYVSGSTKQTHIVDPCSGWDYNASTWQTGFGDDERPFIAKLTTDLEFPTARG